MFEFEIIQELKLNDEILECSILKNISKSIILKK